MAPRDKKGKKKYFNEKPVRVNANQNLRKKETEVNIEKEKPLIEKKIFKKEKKDIFSSLQKLKSYLQNIVNRIFNRQMLSDLIFNPFYFFIAACAFLVFDAVLNVFIIENVKYTEIDWVAYMQEVKGFLNGTLDYTKLQGDTGPLVYPAGFVYIFSLLYFMTDRGTNIYLAQYIFAGVYLLNLALVFRIYHKSKKLPPYVLLFVCCMSYRIHSIFVLRLFNDPVAMAIFYGALNCFISGWWTLGSVLYSLSVSVKMNVLLYAPALLMTYLYCLGILGTIKQLSISLVIQVVLGLPFLLENPAGYVVRSFNLGRIFLYEWTVNWRFLPEEIFVHYWFHITLLVGHILFLAIFAFTHWSKLLVHYKALQSSKMDMSCQLIILPLFISNFVGVAFCRSLHYQFYIWYFHTIPYLLWCTKLSIPSRLLLLGLIELCWNTFPSTWWSSALLHLCHATLLVTLLMNRPNKEKVQNLKKRLLKGD